MMKIKQLLPIIFFLIFYLPFFAEVSTVKDADGHYLSHVFMYKDFPSNEIWEKFSSNPNRISLNENGDANGDGKPSFAIDPATGYPAVVWSRYDGSDYEIAYSYFDGSEWSDFEIITDNNIDDLDPCLAFNNNGTAKVAWWSEEPIQQVYYKIRKNNGEWSLKLRISDPLEKSRFPSIIASDHLSYVTFESLSSTPERKSIIFGTIGDDPDPIPQLISRIRIGTGNYGPNSEAMPHQEKGHLWVDWIYNESFLCWSENIDDEWTPQRFESYSGLPDIPRARLYIKMKVFNGE